MAYQEEFDKLLSSLQAMDDEDSVQLRQSLVDDDSTLKILFKCRKNCRRTMDEPERNNNSLFNEAFKDYLALRAFNKASRSNDGWSFKAESPFVKLKDSKVIDAVKVMRDNLIVTVLRVKCDDAIEREDSLVAVLNRWTLALIKWTKFEGDAVKIVSLPEDDSSWITFTIIGSDITSSKTISWNFSTGETLANSNLNEESHDESEITKI